MPNNKQVNDKHHSKVASDNQEQGTPVGDTEMRVGICTNKFINYGKDKI